MVVAQFTDLQLLPAGTWSEAMVHRFSSCLDTVLQLLRRIGRYLVLGDIADRGPVESYRAFPRAMRRFDGPWLCLIGNHDRADTFALAAGE